MRLAVSEELVLVEGAAGEGLDVGIGVEGDIGVGQREVVRSFSGEVLGGLAHAGLETPVLAMHRGGRRGLDFGNRVGRDSAGITGDFPGARQQVSPLVRPQMPVTRNMEKPRIFRVLGLTGRSGASGNLGDGATLGGGFAGEMAVVEEVASEGDEAEVVVARNFVLVPEKIGQPGKH